ncbi:MAG: hypothetical protein HY890_01470 [Deltaproteobacteria bacterium]|nr:hypothetical protein [Deltaproteobacteria bacterium]
MLFPLMHIIHLLTVIVWIGGLAFITILVIPMVIRMPDALQKVLFFQRIEHRFAPMARVFNVIVGATGIAMLLLTGWHRIIFTREGASLLVMTVIWVFWFIMLFGLEPIIIRRMLANLAKSGEKMEIEKVFARMNRMHRVLLVVSLAASAAGAVFAHRFF